MGAITLLIQDDVGGIKVLKDGMWIPVPALRDGILVILADQTEIITNGRYKSSVHRAVVDAERARLSVATFYDPSKSRKIFTAAKLVSKDEPQKYRDVIYGIYEEVERKMMVNGVNTMLKVAADLLLPRHQPDDQPKRLKQDNGRDGDQN
nr:1-aminocyclopropane-1-carboxylate oxidase 3-like [Setaria viridis]